MIRFDAIRLSGLTNIELPIFGVKVSDPYLVTSVDGLGPPELEVLLAETHTPGGIYINRRAQGREIVIRCGLNPNYKLGQAVMDLRYLLYGLLSPGVDPHDQSISIILLNANVPVLQTNGYVKRIEIVPFAKKPETQITIACLGPYLNAPEQSYMENIPEESSWTLTNVGLAPTGISFEIEIVKPISNFSIEVSGGNKMVFVTEFLAGDRLVVNTSESDRFVGLKRNGTYIRYLELLTPESEWIMLHGGEHTILTSDPTEFNWITFNYRNRYWGI